MNKRGSISILMAKTIPIALVAGVFAVDAARYWLLSARVQAMVDAAALAGARNMNSPTRDADIKAVAAANWNGGAPPLPGQASETFDPGKVTITPGNNTIQVSASVDVKPLLGTITILGYTVPGTAVRTITRSGTAEAASGVELALVFDITLSMIQNDAGGGKTRIQSARDAALTFLSVLYGDNPDKPAENLKWLPNFFISVVPFNVTVNYGSANTHFLAAEPPASDYPVSWSGATRWGGCVEMRSVSLLDANTQSTADGLRRYYWPSTYDPTRKYVQNSSNTSNGQPYCLSQAAYKDNRNGNSNPSGADGVCMGHNDWTAPEYVLRGTTSNSSGDKQNTLIAEFASNSLVRAARLDAWATAHGPNMMCPPDTGDRLKNLTVLPLTRDRATVEARINALFGKSPDPVLPFSYGTNIAAGLQAGWFTLSPNWRKENGFAGWPSAEPLPDSNDPRPPLPDLPLNYYTPNMNKVMIVLTDGDNNWSNAREVQGSGNALVRPESRDVAGFYTAYGKLGRDYPDDDRETVNVPRNLPPSMVASATTTALSSAEARMDSEAEAWCEKIKARVAEGDPEKITIYTIGFGSGIGSRATRVLTNCASVEDGKRLYYPAPSDAELREIFKSIANKLARLRLSQ